MSSYPITTMPSTHIQYVKVKTSGKVSVLIMSRMKYTFKNLLELFMNDKPKPQLDRTTVQHLTNVALMSEIYCKYYTHLHIVRDDVRILITRSQAYAFWELCQEYDHYAYNDAEMGNILMQLHQKIS